MPQLLASIYAPGFPARDFPITAYGAKGDGQMDSTAVIAQALRDGRRLAKPTGNVIIRNCDMKDGHGDVAVAREMSDRVRNVYFRNIEVGEVSDSAQRIDFRYVDGLTMGKVTINRI